MYFVFTLFNFVVFDLVSSEKNSAFSAFCLQCFDAVDWAAERASGL